MEELSDRPLRVLYSFPSRIGVTGIGMTAWNQVAGLAAQGVHVTLFCGTCERPIPNLKRLVETMRIASFKIPYRILGDDRMWSLHDASVARHLNRSPDFDIVHTWPLGAIRTLEAAAKHPIPTFLERPNAHTAFAYDAVSREHAKLGVPVDRSHSHSFNAARLAREELEYSRATRLLCPSDFVAATFTARGVKAQHIARHHYGYDPELFRPAPAIDHANGQGISAIFLGRCEPRKGLHYALQAWHESGLAATGKFYICGSFVPGYREYLAKWLNHPSIVEMGFVTNAQEIMRKCDVLMLPSIEEGSALVTYEARASGLVLLVSDASGAPCEHLTDAMVHQAGDVETLTTHLSMIANDPQLLQRLCTHSLRSIGNYTWAAAASRLRQIYESLARPVPIAAKQAV